jgi:glycine/D-amino acid oxidase-like deaminating enzyme
MPMMTDADSEFYIHRTGRGDLLLGGTDKDTHPGYGSEVDWNIVEQMLAAGARRIPSLAAAQVRRNYVGLRGLTADHLPVLGRVEAVAGIVLACGDNGKGFMHAPAIGNLLSEVIVDGEATSLDLTPFRLERFREPLRTREAFF